jgi:predicted RNase H-like nuclease (RuvC/YqgF family)
LHENASDNEYPGFLQMFGSDVWDVLTAEGLSEKELEEKGRLEAEVEELKETTTMSGTELITGMGEVINYLKQLEAKNKKLQADTEAKEATIRSLSAGLEQYKQEIKELKEKITCLE